jgi:4-hydroxy-tetrahydrodipicolinate reductase
MGSAISELARNSGVDVVATIGDGMPVTRETLRSADVAVEFTVPTAAPGNIRDCIAAGCPIVVGTTGWYDQLPAITEFVTTRNGSMMYAANYSIGVHVMSRLVARAGELIAQLPGFDATLVELHHTAKKDAPSGTAGMLRDKFEASAGRTLPVTSVRVGSVPGTHSLIMDGAFEQIVVSHEARDRRVFAEGALIAAKWLVGRHGTFTLDDMIFSKEDE